jgi:hypothetical protein
LFVALLVVVPVRAQRAERPLTKRIVFEDQASTLRLAPHVTTTIYLPDAVRSIVVGDPNLFQAEHSPTEPLLVFVKPITVNPVESNLFISTARGERFIFLLTAATSSGAESNPDLLIMCKASGFIFIDEAFPTALVAERIALTANTDARDQRAIDFDMPMDPESMDLDRLVDRQRRRGLPALHGEAVRVGIGDTLERGQRMVVLFSVFNSGSEAVELVPPQVQLASQASSGMLRRSSRWLTVQQLPVQTYRITTRRLNAGDRVDGLVVFERPAIKQAHEHLLLQIADSAAVDRPVLSPINYRQTISPENNHE